MKKKKKDIFNYFSPPTSNFIILVIYIEIQYNPIIYNEEDFYNCRERELYV